MKSRARNLPVLLAFFFSLKLSTCSLTAGVRIVTSLADAGFGSLRYEIAASSPGDTIQFGVTGTITLGSAIDINDSLTVQGPGPSALVVDGNHVDRVFLIASGVSTVISGMTISNGYVLGTPGANGGVGRGGGDGGDCFGAGISDSGNSLTLANCWLVGNVAEGGQGGRGGPNVIGATYFPPGNGGTGGSASGAAVYSLSGSLSIVNCTFSQNRAVGGTGGAGGTNVAGSMNMGGTGGEGGAASAAGLLPAAAVAVMSNCTFSANRISGGQGGAGGDDTDGGTGGTGGLGGDTCGGAIASMSPCDFYSCTIVSNSSFAGPGGPGGNGATPGAAGNAGSGSAGALCGYTITCNNDIANTILADNFASTSASNFFAAFKDLGYNFIGSDDFLPSCGWVPTTTVGTIAAPIHPGLGPLAQNGGGLPTHATRYSIPATVTDQGFSFGSTTDERGAPRPYAFPLIPKPTGGDGTDIGAFELGNPDLGAGMASNNLVLSWPAYYGDFTVQSASTLQGSNIWYDVPITPVVISNQLVVTIPVSNATTFYRLINQ